MSVYEGVWYNHAAKQFILTLDVRSGGFLSAAIVTWVNFTAAATWTIWRWALYRYSSVSNKDTTVFHQQRQALLRNSSGAAGTVGALFSLGFSWKGHRFRLLGGSIIQFFACIAIFSLWTLCGLFAPYIYTRAQGDVLNQSSPFCGLLRSGNVDISNITAVNLFRTENIAKVKKAQTYVGECYGASNTSACNDYIQAALPYTTASLDSCPFGTFDVCMSQNSTPIRFDTGLLDSNYDFGLNVKDDQRVQYRRVTTCSPIKTSPFTTIFNTTGTEEEDQYPPGTILLRYNFGPNSGYNWTFQLSEWQSTFPFTYTLSAFQYMAGIGTANTWMVNNTLFDATDADLNLVLLQGNHVEYPSPVDDPIFRAGEFAWDESDIPIDGGSLKIYYSSFPSTALACSEQHQICLTHGDPSCTPLVALAGILNATATLGGIATNEVAIGIAELLESSAIQSSIYLAPFYGGDGTLLASRTLQDLAQTGILPKDQWVAEATNWFLMSLALLQANMLSFAAVPSNPALRS